MSLPSATVVRRNASRVKPLVLGVAVAGAFVFALVWRINQPCGCANKTTIAQAGVKKLANEAYFLWRAAPGHAAGCPSASELAEFSGAAKDPWGQTYAVFCRLDGKAPLVTSAGPDEKLGTRDDFDSTD